MGINLDAAQQNAARTAQAQPLPRVWLIRSERKGADERFNFKHSVTSIHWNNAPDPRTHTREELDAYFAAHPKSGGPDAAEQIWAFCHDVQLGDIVATPLWNEGRLYEKVAVGVIVGDYKRLGYDPEPDPNQTRKTVWVRLLERVSLPPETQRHLAKQRHTGRRIRAEGVVRDLLTAAGFILAEEVQQ